MYRYCTHQTLSDVPCPRHLIVSPIWALVPCPQLLVALPALKMLLSKYGNVLIPGKLSKRPAHLGCTRRHARLRTRAQVTGDAILYVEVLRGPRVVGGSKQGPVAPALSKQFR